MITLQQTAGNNNESIWCLRLRGEGTNLVTLGDFSASTGWTATGDWAIGSGVATYTYDDDATGALYRDLTAAEAVSYILEYEVTNVSGPFWALGASDLTVMGGGSYFFANGVKLDATLGKHSIQLLGNAGGTELRFTITDVAALDTISIDNVKVRKADNVIYLSTKDIELDNTYDGQVLSYDNYLSDVTYPSSIIEGGGTGSVTSFNFSISRHVTNEAFNSFFNEIYPATDAGYLVSRIVDFGICWEGATTDTEITWLLRGRIIDYNYEQRKLNFVVFQESELTNKEVPYYTVQKDFNNEISYFTGAPEDSYGLSIPIIYGDFTNGVFGNDYEISLYNLAPVICVSKRGHRFIVCSHKVHTTSEIGSQEFIFSYLESVDSQLWIKNENAADSSTDNMNGYCLINMKDRAGKLLGSLSVRLTDISSLSDVDDVENAIDNDISTYSDLDASGTGDNRLALRAIGSLSTPDVGYLGFASDDIILFFRLSANAASTRDLTVSYSNPNTTPSAGTSTVGSVNSTTSNTVNYHVFGNSTTAKIEATLPWTIDEVLNLDFIVENNNTTPGEIIRVHNAFLVFYNIIVYNPTNIRFTRNGGRNV